MKIFRDRLINKKKVIFMVLIFLLSGLIIRGVVGWVINLKDTLSIQVIEARPEIVENVKSVSGLISREEIVVFSPTYGKVTFLSPEGKRVPAGQIIAKISENDDMLSNGVLNNEEESPSLSEIAGSYLRGDNDYRNRECRGIVKVTAPCPGTISYYIDGMENIGYNGYYKYFTREEFEQLKILPRRIKPGDIVEKDTPLLKIANNYCWFFSVIVSPRAGKIISNLEKVSFYFDFTDNQKVSAVLVEQEIRDKGQYYLTWCINGHIPSFYKERWISAKLVYEECKGYVVPRKALIDKNNEIMLFTVEDGRVFSYHVTPINVSNEKVVVKGIPAYSKIITTPYLVFEGQFIR